jgi:transposase-like protein
MCPACCSDETRVIESRITAAGKRRRRHKCNVCRHRWTTLINGSAAPRAGQPRKPMPQRTKLTATQIHTILLDKRSHRAVAREIGRSTEAIRQIRIGAIHAQVHPEVPRWEQPIASVTSDASCYKCQHWAERCTFGYPDPLEEGPGFANDCAMYAPPDTDDDDHPSLTAEERNPSLR